MRRTDLIGTTMALSLAVFMSAVATGCGKNDIDTDVTQPDVIETMATIESSEAEETPSVVAEYEVTNLQVPYVVMINTDTFLMDNPNTAGKIVDLAKESIVTVTGDVTFGGIATEFYYVDYQNGENIVSGFVDGKYIDFNSKVEDSMMGYEEVEGGDGIETTTEVEETTEIEETETPTVAEMSTKSTEVLFDTPIAMYTTQNCNVRSRADKESELIMTLAKDVEIYCWGTDGDWSVVDCQGIKAYIHSSLLTKTKPAPAQTTKPAEQSKPAQTQTPAQTTQQTQQKPAETKPQTPAQPSGTITAVTPEGQTVTLRPYKPEKGIYLDETGAARNASGQRVNIVTGEPYVDAFDGTADVPCDGMSIDEMTEILKQYDNLKVN